jgi:hypothetical protein
VIVSKVIPKKARKGKPTKSPAIDLRRQLFNEGRVGRIEQIQVSASCIVQLNGILFDLDPPLYRSGSLTQGLSKNPEKFYKNVVRPWLDRHVTLKNCEVRATGTGLHAILWFDKPVVFNNVGDRDRWAGIVKVVQAALPIDPDQPGITATTRALKSINSKNGAVVRQLSKGTPVTQADVLALFNEMCSSPFESVLKILTGGDSVTPCPVCGKDGTQLAAMDYAGRCYGSCGTVKLETLYDLVFTPRMTKEATKNHGEDDE